MATRTTASGRLRVGLKLLGFLVLSCALGCGQSRYSSQEGLDQRILPPQTLDIPEEFLNTKKTVQDASNGIPARLEKPKSSPEADPENARLLGSAGGNGAGCGPAQVLTLADAIDMAFHQQPRLRVYLEGVEQARGAEDIAFAPFLPMAMAGYSVGGFDLNVGGNSVPLGPCPGSPSFPAWDRSPLG